MPHLNRLPKTALVTGAASGIGRALVNKLASLQCRCVLVDIQANALDEMVRTLPGQHQALVCDLTSPQAAREMLSKARDGLDRLDLIVNCAGMTTSAGLPFAELDLLDMQRLMAVNLQSVVAICEQAPEHLNELGVVVNVASGAAFRALPLRGLYSASKAGVVALTARLSQDWRGKSIDARAVAPGFVETAMTQGLAHAGALDFAAVKKRIPLNRVGQASEIADAILMLATMPSTMFAGQTLLVDGGSSAAAGLGFEPAKHAVDQSLPLVADDWVVRGESAWCDQLRLALGDRGRDSGDTREGGVDQASGLIYVVDDLQRWTQGLAEFQRLAKQCSGKDGRPAFHSLTFLDVRQGQADVAVERSSFHMWLKTLALELAPAGVRVNGLSCTSAVDAQALAQVIVQLAGEAGRYVTAQILDLEGAGV